ncbi:low molecular weight protein arginine phosphatase [Gilliamella sp. B2894]|uniref:low molecular weight protein arginine phosphatase n=1 Tax=unclassified Gilliamella TaxID=2685620 RepID=UPI002269CE5C|nr:MULTISPECIES: low molecular weight protein arginine phosphatase [unclassified Gilliamella]MCX8656414.1 low molecular weight protein arginine phosphatase [Gilliamella sp. B2894]MCX8693031.1 low molecular weight protein arginine phosphatase [Gilliamella sp. B2881]MCX8696184.1 low molecular weight protein arginine phosphatase [Gilliamella sp. B2828]
MFNLKKYFLIILALFSTSCFSLDRVVMFVCTGNTGRSPMAEALAKDYVKKHHLNIIVESRGVNVDPNEITPEEGSVKVLKNRNIDISSHKAAQLVKEDIDSSDYLLTMTQNHKDKILDKFPESEGKVFTLSEFATGKNEDLSDPYKMPMAAYIKVENQLDKFLPLALDKIAKEE